MLHKFIDWGIKVSLRYLAKVSALAILALGIVACSSGGHHSKPSANLPPLTEQTAAEKAAADKAAAAKAAAEKAAAEKAAAEKAAAEKAAAAKAAAEKAAAEKAAAEKAAAEKAAADKAEKERLQKIEANRLALNKKAQDAGLNAERAKQFADNNVNTAETNIAKALNAEVSKAVLADKGGVYAKAVSYTHLTLPTILRV